MHLPHQKNKIHNVSSVQMAFDLKIKELCGEYHCSLHSGNFMDNASVSLIISCADNTKDKAKYKLTGQNNN